MVQEFSPTTLREIELTMKALGCINTTSDRMHPGNLRFLDPRVSNLNEGGQRKVEYVVYTSKGTVRRLESFGCRDGIWNPPRNVYRLNRTRKGRIKNRKYSPTIRITLEDEGALVALLIRGVLNYRHG
jgi:hypothetical protein